jgi:L-asparaginase
LLAGESLTALDGSATLLNDAALGPILSDSSGNVLWTALEDPAAVLMPARLQMQNDGNLVLFDRDNSVAWATNTGIDGPAPSMLILSGSTSSNDLRLWVLNYLTMDVTATIYAQ